MGGRPSAHARLLRGRSQSLQRPRRRSRRSRPQSCPNLRFEPGPQARVASGDASPSHGGHAGGITLGGFGSSKFQSGWDWGYAE